MIDLTELLTDRKSSIILDESYKIDKKYLENTSIYDISKIKLTGTIKKDESCNIELNAEVSGKIKIKDSVTLDEVWYPISFEIDEIIDELLKNNENILDIIEFLWQNIVLEVPLRYSTVEDYSRYQGDGWKLVSEEELKNNPFKTLLDDKEKE